MNHAGETHGEPTYMYLLSRCLKMEPSPFYGTAHITSVHDLQLHPSHSNISQTACTKITLHLTIECIKR